MTTVSQIEDRFPPFLHMYSGAFSLLFHLFEHQNRLTLAYPFLHSIWFFFFFPTHSFLHFCICFLSFFLSFITILFIHACSSPSPPPMCHYQTTLSFIVVEHPTYISFISLCLYVCVPISTWWNACVTRWTSESVLVLSNVSRVSRTH